MRRILYKFTHGLGDAVQFTIVLKHLAKYRPDHEISVAALIGKHSCFRGLCHRVYVLDREPIDCTQFDDVMDVGWYENYSGNVGSPHTKVCNFLREELGIAPDLSLFKYAIDPTAEARAAARAYLESICGPQPTGSAFRVVLIHYEGNTSADRKNLPHELIEKLCREILSRGYTPIILDWDNRSPIPDQRTIFNPGVHVGDPWGSTGTGDAGVLAAMIELSELVIGVDSGPLHVAGATETPTVGIWTGHAPIQFFDLCPNVVHLVPKRWLQIYPHNVSRDSREFFATHYKFETYGDLLPALAGCVAAVCDPPAAPEPAPVAGVGHENLIHHAGFWIRAENVEQDMVIVRNIFLEDAYRLDIIADRVRQAEFVVDVGAHIGTFAAKVHSLNPSCKIICCECCRENLPALHRNVGHFATIVDAACTYEPGELVLLNAYHPNCRSTGGSTVVRREEATTHDPQYRAEALPKRTTLEQLMWPWCFDHIDILKLDCEGSEFSILENTPSLRKIAFILGEYHGQARWEHLCATLFAEWDRGRMSEEGDLGNFHLRNPSFQKGGTDLKR